MNEGELAAATRRATYDVARAEASACGGPVEEIDGVLCHSTLLPVPQWNGAHVVRPPNRPVPALQATRDWFADLGVPYGVLVPAELEPALAAACGAAGLALETVQPVMALTPEALRPAPLPAELEVREPSDVADVIRVTAPAFAEPEAESRRFLGPQVAAAGWRIVVGYVDGEPVATASAALTPGAVGVYGVATLAKWQRRGYGAALTTLVIRHGFTVGARFAHLNPSEQARSGYLRLGFRPLPGWAIWLPRPG